MLHDRVMLHIGPVYGSDVPVLVLRPWVRLSDSPSLLGSHKEKANKNLETMSRKDLTAISCKCIVLCEEDKGSGIELFCDETKGIRDITNTRRDHE